MTQTTLRDFLRETEDSISAGRYDEAMAKCQTILSYFPEALEAQRLLGEVYLAQGQLEEAQQTFDWILTNDPENVIVYCDRALISERVSDIDTALDCYQQAYELSRGNSHIRQEFNQLSARVGQQEFMFSRAGLARLYMRGDLLTQAIQEWEAVLASNPERLDARLGLMETYWREGYYDRVEQLATELLEEIPTCLKALLLLAYVVSISNMKRARELVARAEMLDPELALAQELFSDLIASQPSDPFLTLLRKQPIFFSNGELVIREAPVEKPVVEPAKSNGASHIASTSGAQWGKLDSWSEIEGAATIQQAAQGAPESPITSFTQSNSAELVVEPTASAGVSNGKEAVADPFEAWPELESGEAVGGGSAPEETLMEKQPWYQAEQFAPTDAPSEEASNTWENLSGPGSVQENEGWSMGGADEEQLTPPAWLDTLTRNERRQISGAMPTLPPQPSSPLPIPPASPMPAQPAAQQASEASAAPTPKQVSATPSVPEKEMREKKAGTADTPIQAAEEDALPFFFATDDSDNDMGWPEWLKSLGAAPLESEAPEIGPLSSSAPASPEATGLSTQEAAPTAFSQGPHVQEAQPSYQLAQPEEEPTREEWERPQTAEWEQPAEAAQNAWMSMADPWAAQPTGEAPWAQHPSAAEWMQQLAPNTWSASEPAAPAVPMPARQAEPAPVNQHAEPAGVSWLDQLSAGRQEDEQRQLASLEELERSLYSQGFVPIEPGTLSAIAQAQNQQVVQETEKPAREQQDLVAETRYSEQAEVPTLSSALAQLGNFSQQPGWVQDRGAQPVFSNAPTASVPALNETREDQTESKLQALTGANTAYQSGEESSAIFTTPGEARTRTSELPSWKHPQEAAQPEASAPAKATGPLQPAQIVDPLLNSDLETTMKRPAVRLQPMQATGQKDKSGGRPRGEHKAAERGEENSLSNQERLVRGYQYQLSGAYDDAMQEYRLIIRNAPELLGEVISNVRALLKLAPRYSLGYRVLGDAYMRQGEYLQAMEAYNKALTMAKKARS